MFADTVRDLYGLRTRVAHAHETPTPESDLPHRGRVEARSDRYGEGAGKGPGSPATEVTHWTAGY